MGGFCKQQELTPTRILTSPYERAKQTAFLVAQELGDSPNKIDVEIAPFLACGMSPETALDQVGEMATFPSIMLVGHEPDLSHLCAHLLGSSSHCIHIRKASLTLIETTSFRAGAGVLHFSIPVELIRL